MNLNKEERDIVKQTLLFVKTFFGLDDQEDALLNRIIADDIEEDI